MEDWIWIEIFPGVWAPAQRKSGEDDDAIDEPVMLDDDDRWVVDARELPY